MIAHHQKISIVPPVLWRYIIQRYCQYLGICLFGIVALLLATKLDEVARFIALGASAAKIGLFILYQIPYILQIALPFASLVAGFSTLSMMSSQGELTAARASGYSLRAILAPLSVFSLLLSILMMWGVFDLSARCHLTSKKLEFDVREEQPLAFIQSGRFLSEHAAALELRGSLCIGDEARELLLCFPSPGGNRLSLVILQSAKAETNALLGSALTVISSKPPVSTAVPFGSLVIEHADAKKTPTGFVHELAQKKHWKPDVDQFPMSVVRAKFRTLQREIAAKNFQQHSAKKLQRQLQKTISEPFRRLSLSLAVFSLCMAGAVCGIRTSRLPKNLWHIVGPLLGFGLFITSYLTGKNLDEIAVLSIFFYLIPHAILWYFSASLRSRLDSGMEY